MKGYISYRKSIDSERWIYVGDGKSLEVKSIRGILDYYYYGSIFIWILKTLLLCRHLDEIWFQFPV